MTRKIVTDEQLGQLCRRLNDFMRRVEEGTIPLKRAMDDIQHLIEGKTFQCYIIDCDADPHVSDGWKVEEHKKGGKFVWDPTRVRLHLSPRQQNGKQINGNELRKELAKESVLNANVLDYLLAHPTLIPEEWKDKAVFFWGTIYRLSGGGLYVRYLDWGSSQWDWHYSWLDDDWRGSHPAACSPSIFLELCSKI